MDFTSDYEKYNPNTDYKTLHLAWLKEKKGFRPKIPCEDCFPNYYTQMEHAYRRGHLKLNTTAFLYLRDDYRHDKGGKSVSEEVAELFGDKVENKNPKFFVTFNWTDSNFDVDHALRGVERLFNKAWVDEGRGVFEYHGEKKNHPHFMCVIQVNKNKTLSKFKEKMVTSYIANGLNANFVDVKPWAPRHEDYVDLDKQQSKQEALDKDIIWRNEHGLAHEYKKNNSLEK